MKYYGDNSRWFMGTVVNINDPLELGRIKVRIYGVHTHNTSEIENGDLPWAQVVVPVTEGGSSGIGTNIGIKVQAQVYGVFLDGRDSQLPLVLGSVPRYERPVSTQNLDTASSVPDQAQHDEKVYYPPGIGPINNTSVDDRYLVGADNNEKAFNFFLTKEGGSFEPHVVCGILGNFFVESAAEQNKKQINPQARSNRAIVNPLDLDSIEKSNQDGIENSFGIAQWNSAAGADFRYQALVQFAAERNMQWTDLYAQLLFTVKELNDKKGYYRLNELKRAKTIEEATFIFESRFENPQNKKQKKRVEAAEALFRALCCVHL